MSIPHLFSPFSQEKNPRHEAGILLSYFIIYLLYERAWSWGSRFSFR